MSIAKATGRKFVRMSLGGVRDEAEIRGHRRTYIGALPGQIIQMMKKSGTKNPVFMLDEVDKCRWTSVAIHPPPCWKFWILSRISCSWIIIWTWSTTSRMFFHRHGQRDSHDSAGPPGPHGSFAPARLHRLEKIEIAKQFLVKKQMAQAGLTDKNLKFSDEALTGMIRCYTREAGVRNLEREIGNVCRKVARKVVKEGESYNTIIKSENVNDFLGVIKFRDTLAHEKAKSGWSQAWLGRRSVALSSVPKRL